jgi:hypothetical protein
MSNRSEGGMVRIRHRIAYGGKGFDMLGETIKSIGKAHPYAQKIGPLEVGKGFIPVEELVPANEVGDRIPLSVHEAARRARMEEFSIKSSVPFTDLFELFNIVHEEGLYPGFFAMGDKGRFQKWLGVRIPRMSLFGVTVVQQQEIPHDVFLLCGTDLKDPDPEDIKFSLKVTLP